MNVLIGIMILFVYLVIGAILDAEYNIGPCMLVWPLLIPLFLAYKVGYAIHEYFFEEKRWKKLFEKGEDK